MVYDEAFNKLTVGSCDVMLVFGSKVRCLSVTWNNITFCIEAAFTGSDTISVEILPLVRNF